MRHSPQQAEVPYFYDPALSGRLPETEAHHARQTLRLRRGDHIRVGDGKGRSITARIVDLTRKGDVAYESLKEQNPWGPGEVIHPPGPFVAFCPVLKQPDRMEWLAEKLQELGTIRHLCWVTYDRDQARRPPPLERLERLGITALKQARTPWLMTQTHHKSLKVAFDSLTHIGLPMPLGQHTVFGYLGPEVSSIPLSTWAPKLEAKALCVTVIGPEADFSSEELSLLSGPCQGQAVSLGPTRLRAETAALLLNAYLSLTIV